MKQLLRPTALAVILSLAAGLLLLLATLFWLQQSYRNAVTATATLEPRHARIQGIAEAGPELAAMHASARRQLEAVAYGPELDDSNVGTGIQQRTRRYATQAGLEVSGSQILPARAREGFAEIGVNVTVQGSMSALQNFLATLQQEPPRLYVTSINLSPRRVRRNELDQQVITATVNISGYRVVP